MSFFLFLNMFWGSLCLYLKVKVERGCNQWGWGSRLVTGLLFSELFLMSWAWSICQNEAAALVLVANIWKLVKPNLSVWTDTAHLSGNTCFFSDPVGPTLQHFHRIRCAHWEVSNCEMCHPPPHKGSNIFWELQISQKRKKKKTTPKPLHHHSHPQRLSCNHASEKRGSGGGGVGGVGGCRGAGFCLFEDSQCCCCCCCSCWISHSSNFKDAKMNYT